MRVLIAIPVFNEERYVLPVLDKVLRYAEDVLVIDDGSSDATPTLLARQEVDVIRHRTNYGYGRSIRDAFQWSRCYAYDWLITMDCDEQHEPESLPDFFEAIRRGGADVVSGSRYLDPAKMDGSPPADRRRINAMVTDWVNQCLGLHITDAFCGFKAYRVSTLKELALDVDGYALPLQQWVQTAAASLRVTEVPIRLIYNDPNRTFGGPLDDPDERLALYREVFRQEMAKHPARLQPCEEAVVEV